MTRMAYVQNLWAFPLLQGGRGGKNFCPPTAGTISCPLDLPILDATVARQAFKPLDVVAIHLLWLVMELRLVRKWCSGLGSGDTS